MRDHWLTFVAMLGLLTSAACPIRADVFKLVGGGQVEGELANPDEKPRKSYVVQLATGGKLTIDAAQVDEYVAVRAEEEEYLRVRPTYADTVEGQWALAQWCHDRNLDKQRETHLERVIELDPNHAAARRALGFSQVDGRWVQRDDIMLERGYKRYKGAWRTQQEIELMESKRKQELAEKDWFQKINRWRGWLAGGGVEQARQNFAAIDDPAAVKALIHGLQTDNAREAKLIYLEVLSRLATSEALKAMAVAALNDSDEEVRLSCLDELAKKKSTDAVSYFCSQLRSKDNAMVNLAGTALGRMQDRSAIAPLIDALVTVHKYKITSGSPGQTSASFGSGAPGGFSFGNSTKIIKKTLTNQSVLDALVSLTGGQNFNFDQRAWKHWFAMQKQRQTIDARRD